LTKHENYNIIELKREKGEKNMSEKVNNIAEDLFDAITTIAKRVVDENAAYDKTEIGIIIDDS
jgi:hypothetical protein